MIKIRHLFILSLVIFSSCTKNERKNYIYGSGTLEATQVNISSKIIGRISELYVKEGDRVSKNQIIAKLDDAEQADRDFNRLKTLFEQNVIPPQEYEKIKNYRDNFYIFTPVSGTVILQELNCGEIATPGQPIFTIADMSQMWIKIFVPSKDIGKINLMSECDIIFDSIPKEVFKGYVSYISETAEFIPKNIQTKEERLAQVFAVKVLIKNPDNRLKIGMPADVYIKP